MDQWFRRNILIGAVGALAACSSSPPEDPPLTADWLLGRWEGGVEGQLLVVTSVESHRNAAIGARAAGSWANEPVTIAVHGGQISFNTASGLSVQLAQSAGLLIGTVDRAPWLPAGQPLARLFLRHVQAPRTT